jgi:hypothetical protein
LSESFEKRAVTELLLLAEFFFDLFFLVTGDLSKFGSRQNNRAWSQSDDCSEAPCDGLRPPVVFVLYIFELLA